MLHFPPFRLDTVNGLLWRGNQRLHLHAKSQAVLRSLIEQAKQPLSLVQLQQTVWQDTIISPKNIKVYIHDIRKALEDDPQNPQFIETIPKVGYRFIGTIQKIESTNRARDSTTTAAVSNKELSDLPDFFFETVSTRLVGRDKELAKLRAWLPKALSGRRQIIFIAGESGLGKTALTHAFQEQFSTIPQIWTAVGHCVEHFGVGEGYLPIFDALSQLQTPEQRAMLTSLLQQYAPSWLAQLPSLLSAEHPLRLGATPYTTRERMLREFFQFIEGLTDQIPLVLILEDLHWSDPSTIDLLLALAQQRGAARLLLIGTYRPESIYSGKHPLRFIFQELRAHRLCSELTLAPLSESAIQAYLETYFPRNKFPSTFPTILRARTEGNPLFLTSLLESFVTREIISWDSASWLLTKPLTALTQETPESFHLLLERQIESLSTEERQILEAGSVAGLEFSTAAVAYSLKRDVVAVESSCDSLARRRQFLQPAGSSEWPDGERSSSYAFLHALTREAWNKRVPVARKQQLHQRVGERLEAAYHGIEEEIAAELAMHFTGGSDKQRAIKYHHVAGRKATRQLAYHEAIFHYSSALSLLRSPPRNTKSAPSLELQLQLALTQPLIAVKGWAAPETQQAYGRAHELSNRNRDLTAQFTALSGLWVVAYTRAELRKAYELAQQLLCLARRNRKVWLKVEAYHALGNTQHRRGDLRSAQKNLQQGIAFYNRQRRISLPPQHGLDTGVAGQGYLAWVLWTLGYPEQAQQYTKSMLTLAQELSDPLHLAWALNSAAWHAQYQRAPHAALRYAGAGLPLSEEHGFTQLHAVGSIVQGWALASLGKHQQGIHLMEEGLVAGQNTGATIGQPRYFTVLAEAYGTAGENSKALELFSQAEKITDTTGESFYAAELHRLRAKILLNQKQSTQRPTALRSLLSTDQDIAEKSFLKALTISRRQQAKSFELRATIDVGRLWQAQGKHRAAYRLLKKIYSWFTEGLNTADLQTSQALLSDLSEQAPKNKRALTASLQRQSTLF